MFGGNPLVRKDLVWLYHFPVRLAYLNIGLVVIITPFLVDWFAYPVVEGTLYMLTFACAGIVMYWTLSKSSNCLLDERWLRTLEPLMATSLARSQVILGKLWAILLCVWHWSLVGCVCAVSILVLLVCQGLATRVVTGLVLAVQYTVLLVVYALVAMASSLCHRPYYGVVCALGFFLGWLAFLLLLSRFQLSFIAICMIGIVAHIVLGVALWRWICMRLLYASEL